MSSVKNKRTSLEYSFRSAVNPGQSFQDFSSVIPYQIADDRLILKHSEFKKPYAMGVTSYQVMEYRDDTPSPFYPPGSGGRVIDYPTFKPLPGGGFIPPRETSVSGSQPKPGDQPRPTPKKPVIEPPREKRPPWIGWMPPPFLYPPYDLSTPPEPGNNPGPPKRKDIPKPTRRQPPLGWGWIPWAGGKRKRKSNDDEPYIYGDFIYDGCKETVIPIRTSQYITDVDLLAPEDVLPDIDPTVTRRSVTINAGSNPHSPVNVSVRMRSADGKTIEAKIMKITPNLSSYPCSTCVSIGYTSQQMAVNGEQTLTCLDADGNPVAGHSCEWEVTSGGGSITSDGVYTAPATNAECAGNPTISLKCGGSVVATLSLAVNAYGLCILAVQDCCDYSPAPGYDFSCLTSYDCQGGFCSPPWIHSACSCATGQFSGAPCGGGWDNDKRTAAMITGGCCPAQLL